MLKRLIFLLFVILLSIPFISVSAIGESSKNIDSALAIVGEDFNIYTYNFAEDVLNQLTDDASDSRHYQWPTWSTDGRLAYFCCDLRVAQALGAEVMISQDGIQSGKLAYNNPNESIIYAYWSPADCATGCRDLAMLTNNLVDGDMALKMLRDNQDETGSETIADGGPFYYHWDSTGTQMVFHRFNERIDIYNFAENDISATFNNSSGTFQAPAWSPIDNRILVAVAKDSRDSYDLAIIEDDEVHVLVSDLSGLIAFLWSPDGRYVAYRTLTQLGIGEITVIDAENGDTIATGQNMPAIAFFWSPDSSKIAYISNDNNRQSANKGTFLRIQDDSPTTLTWMILDVEADANLSYSSFEPSYELGYLLLYFDQFSPSHRLWSPDSRYFAYSDTIELDGEERGLIKVIDTQQSSRSPQVIADGYFAVWSFE